MDPPDGFKWEDILVAAAWRVVSGPSSLKSWGDNRPKTRDWRKKINTCALALGWELKRYEHWWKKLFVNCRVEELAVSDPFHKLELHFPKEKKEDVEGARHTLAFVILWRLTYKNISARAVTRILRFFRKAFAKKERITLQQHLFAVYDAQYHLDKFQDRNQLLLDHWREHGSPPPIDENMWKAYKVDLEKLLAEEFKVKRPKVLFLSLPSDPPRFPVPKADKIEFIGGGKDRGVDMSTVKKGPEPVTIDIDAEMKDGDYHACVIHNESKVFFATFSSELCRQLNKEIEFRHHIDSSPSDLVLKGVKATAEDDIGQSTVSKGSKNRYTANFGLSVREQGLTSTDKNVLKHVGSRQLDVCIKNESKSVPSFEKMEAIDYYKSFLPVFFQDWESIKNCTTKSNGDRWYCHREHSDQATRVPRISCKCRLDSHKRIRYPYSRLSSLPIAWPKNERDLAKLVAACWETIHRYLVEQLTLHVFSPLPYMLSGFIAHENASKLFQKFLPGHAQKNLSRPFPKGSCGVELCKSLHDDENGLICPGFWSNVTIDHMNKVELHFKSMKMAWKIICDENRFAVFDGCIPHKTCIAGKKRKVMSSGIRLHHSCYTKPLYEYIGLGLFSEDNRNNLNFEEKKRCRVSLKINGEKFGWEVKCPKKQKKNKANLSVGKRKKIEVLDAVKIVQVKRINVESYQLCNANTKF